MSPLSRRRLLRAAASVALAGVAGCGGDRPAPTATPAVDRPTVDYDAVTVRDPDGDSFVRYEDRQGESESDRYTDALVSTADDADRVTFTRDVAGVAEARTFLAETAFGREVVYVSEQPVGECRTLQVDAVSTEGDSFDLDFCAPLRPADVACSVDRRDVVAAFVRFPFGADSPSSYTVGHGGSCREPPRGESA
jgi:hypothetical protein